MEPVFTPLGQTTAAAVPIDANRPIQEVDYPTLRERLLADAQVLNR